tara:strand:+ start:3995 stop:4435 length:441 start_codon:yes stop_codon:yes gene_type:complete
MIGDYGAKKPHWGALSCFSGIQSMIGVCNTFYLIVCIITVATFRSLCYECVEAFDNGNDTCPVSVRNHSDIVLTKSWCTESPTVYFVPLLIVCTTIYLSFRSAISARKMGQTKKIQVITLNQVAITPDVPTSGPTVPHVVDVPHVV